MSEVKRVNSKWVVNGKSYPLANNEEKLVFNKFFAMMKRDFQILKHQKQKAT